MYHVSATILVSNPSADSRSEQPTRTSGHASTKARRSERSSGICCWKSKNPLNVKFLEGVSLILLRGAVVGEGENSRREKN